MVTVNDETKQSFKDAIEIRSAINVLRKYESFAIAYGWDKLHAENPDVDFSKLYYDVKTDELKEREVPENDTENITEIS